MALINWKLPILSIRYIKMLNHQRRCVVRKSTGPIILHLVKAQSFRILKFSPIVEPLYSPLKTLRFSFFLNHKRDIMGINFTTDEEVKPIHTG